MINKSNEKEIMYIKEEMRIHELLKDKKTERHEILIATAHALLTKKSFITLRDSDDMFYYCNDEKIWLKNGPQQVRELSHKINSKFSVNDINEIIEKIKRMSFIDRDKLNPGHLLAVRNGVINNETGLFETARSSHYITARLEAEYSPEKDCPLIKKFFSEILAEKEAELLLEAFSYTLHRDYHIHKAFLLIGDGANGKTTVLELLETFLGKENVSNVPLQAFEQNQFMSAELFGKRANICSDLGKKSLNDLGMLKMLTGNDTVKGERKRCDPFYFKSYAKMFYSMNKLPPIYQDNTHSVWRRIELIEFKRIFRREEQDPNLLQKLTSDDEMSGLLNLLLNRLHRLLTRGYFQSLRNASDTKIRYKLMSNSSQAFCELAIKVEMNEFIPTANVYENYRSFCNDLGLDVKSKSALMRVIPMNVAETFPVRQNKVRGWKNIKIDLKIVEEIKKQYFGDACDAKTTRSVLSGHETSKKLIVQENVSFVSHVSHLILDVITSNNGKPVPINSIISSVTSLSTASKTEINRIVSELNNRGEIFMPVPGMYLKI